MPRYSVDRLDRYQRWHRLGLLDDDDDNSSDDSDLNTVSSISTLSPSPSPEPLVGYRSSDSDSNTDNESEDNNSVANHSQLSIYDSSDSDQIASNSDSNHSVSDLLDRSRSPSPDFGINSIRYSNSDSNSNESGQDRGNLSESDVENQSDLSSSHSLRSFSSNSNSDVNNRQTGPFSFGSVNERSDNSTQSNSSGFGSLLGILNRFGDTQRPAATPDYFGIIGSNLGPAPGTQEFSSSMTTQIMTGQSAATRRVPSSISYECSVCLESLDAPASIDDNIDNDNGENSSYQTQGTVATLRSQRRGRVGASARTTPSLSQRSSASNVRNQNISPTDVVATHCGHLYHQVCLEKWFSEQGRRSCPSCRKLVPKTKVIRLFPSCSTDGRPRNQSDVVLDTNPGPSTSTGNTVSLPNKPPTAQPPVLITNVNNNGGECQKPECQDLKIFHNTLINDFNDLQVRFNTIRESDELKEAQIRSLEEDNCRHLNEIQRLKRQMEEILPVTGSTNKRRRQ